jgi:hypothetical protein
MYRKFVYFAMLLLARTTLAEDSEYRGVPWSSYAWQQQDKAIGEKMLDVSIALAIQNVDTAVEALVSISDPTSSQYGQHWTPSKISEIFTPAEYAVSSVLEWLSSHGISKGNVYRSFGGGHLHLSQRAGGLSSTSNNIFHVCKPADRTKNNHKLALSTPSTRQPVY